MEVRGTNWERNGDLDLKGNPRPYLQEKQRPAYGGDSEAGIGGRTRHPDWAEVEAGTYKKLLVTEREEPAMGILRGSKDTA